MSGCGKPGTVGVNTTIPNETYVSPSSVIGSYTLYSSSDLPRFLGIYSDDICFIRTLGSDYTIIGEWSIRDGNQLVIFWNYAVHEDNPDYIIRDDRFRSIMYLRIEGDRLIGESGDIWGVREEV